MLCFDYVCVDCELCVYRLFVGVMSCFYGLVFIGTPGIVGCVGYFWLSFGCNVLHAAAVRCTV